ncbi:hypothetical protein V5O48_003329 [Marasmius crinis-equi]|uniref:HMG box domain-containing protein n=1 Tax=Marasmius crinis-equi TaxID=585013 RepID=A0ABR3FTL1_9AGAR
MDWTQSPSSGASMNNSSVDDWLTSPTETLTASQSYHAPPTQLSGFQNSQGEGFPGHTQGSCQEDLLPIRDWQNLAWMSMDSSEVVPCAEGAELPVPTQSQEGYLEGVLPSHSDSEWSDRIRELIPNMKGSEQSESPGTASDDWSPPSTETALASQTQFSVFKVQHAHNEGIGSDSGAAKTPQKKAEAVETVSVLPGMCYVVKRTSWQIDLVARAPSIEDCATFNPQESFRHKSSWYLFRTAFRQKLKDIYNVPDGDWKNLYPEMRKIWDNLPGATRVMWKKRVQELSNTSGRLLTYIPYTPPSR